MGIPGHQSFFKFFKIQYIIRGPLGRKDYSLNKRIFLTIGNFFVILFIILEGVTFMATVKTAISIQEPLFHEVDALAREMSISRSQLFVLAVQEYLRQIRNRELLKKINQAYSGEPDHQEKALADRKKSDHLRMVEGEW